MCLTLLMGCLGICWQEKNARALKSRITSLELHIKNSKVCGSGLTLPNSNSSLHSKTSSDVFENHSNTIDPEANLTNFPASLDIQQQDINLNKPDKLNADYYNFCADCRTRQVILADSIRE